MRIHFLKTLSEYFKKILIQEKQFELRKDDRNYQEDDILILIEVDENGKMKKDPMATYRKVDYLLKDEKYLQHQYVAMSLSPISVYGFLSENEYREFKGHYDRIRLSGKTYSYEV